MSSTYPPSERQSCCGSRVPKGTVSCETRTSCYYPTHLCPGVRCPANQVAPPIEPNELTEQQEAFVAALGVKAMGNNAKLVRKRLYAAGRSVGVEPPDPFSS